MGFPISASWTERQGTNTYNGQWLLKNKKGKIYATITGGCGDSYFYPKVNTPDGVRNVNSSGNITSYASFSAYTVEEAKVAVKKYYKKNKAVAV